MCLTSAVYISKTRPNIDRLFQSILPQIGFSIVYLRGIFLKFCKNVYSKFYILSELKSKTECGIVSEQWITQV